MIIKDLKNYMKEISNDLKELDSFDTGKLNTFDKISLVVEENVLRKVHKELKNIIARNESLGSFGGDE